MAILVFTNCFVSVNGVDLSDHVKSVKFNVSAAMLDATVMGGDGYKINLAGLKDFSIDIEFLQDYAAAEIDATLWPLVGATSFDVVLKPVNAAVSATNPSYTCPVVLATYSPITANVGDLGVAPVAFACAGAITRAVA